MYHFKDQRVIVTGGTRGIGKAISQAFLEAGATVIATYLHNREKAEEFLQNNANYDLEIAQCDCTNELEVQNFFEDLEDKYSSIEILVNNAGIRKDQLLATMKKDDFEAVINTNLTGTFLMSKYSILQFLKNRYGRIINISSISGVHGIAGQGNYAASKAGQIAIAKSLSKEVAKKKITVNSILPGFIETEMLDGLPPEQLKNYIKEIPLKRLGQAREVAHGVLFLASRNASYITGTTLEISGGM